MLTLPVEASRPDIILKVGAGRAHTHMHRHTCTDIHARMSTHTKLVNPAVLLQGNQMTLVFMEREYSSPEEPHLGIVHIVEVSSPCWRKQYIATQALMSEDQRKTKCGNVFLSSISPSFFSNLFLLLLITFSSSFHLVFSSSPSPSSFLPLSPPPAPSPPGELPSCPDW